MSDLTVSAIDRQNILNNRPAIQSIQTYIGVKGMEFDGVICFTRSQVANFYGVDQSTIDRYLSKHESELRHNGYGVLKGKALKEFKAEFGWMIDEGAKAPQLGIFNFRSFLNLGMLLTESEKAKALRSKILDIVIDTLNQKLGGSTKYINQREGEFIVALAREPVYRKEFTNALRDFLDMGNYKYAHYTDEIYRAIFLEKAVEYKRLLKLEDQQNLRDTLYSEVLRLIASFEVGIADEMSRNFKKLGRKLHPHELDKIINDFSKQRHWIPQLEDARYKMASRDYGFRKVLHQRLRPYLKSLSTEEYERFMGDKSKSLLQRVEENPELIEVFKRLKDR